MITRGPHRASFIEVMIHTAQHTYLSFLSSLLSGLVLEGVGRFVPAAVMPPLNTEDATVIHTKIERTQSDDTNIHTSTTDPALR